MRNKAVRVRMEPAAVTDLVTVPWGCVPVTQGSKEMTVHHLHVLEHLNAQAQIMETAPLEVDVNVAPIG